MKCLLILAKQLPATTDELRSVRSLPESMLTKHAEEWLAMIAAARGEAKLPPHRNA